MTGFIASIEWGTLSQDAWHGTGKSTCCMSLLVALRHNFPVINVFSGSEADNPFYSHCIPKLFINARVSKRGLKQFINRQRLAIAHNSPLKDALLILDDCFDHPGALDNDMMRMLYKQGRHLRSSVWCVQQYVVDLKPWARSTTSAIFLFHCPNARDRKQLWGPAGRRVPGGPATRTMAVPHSRTAPPSITFTASSRAPPTPPWSSS